jgi:hypothetical protein
MNQDNWPKLYCRAIRDGHNGAWNCPSIVMQKSGATIPKIIAREAYKEYADQGHGDQSFEQLHERGGFGAEEIAILLFDRIKRIEVPESRLPSNSSDTDRLDWLDRHCAFVADHEYNIGPFKIGELREMADAGIAADKLHSKQQQRKRCIPLPPAPDPNRREG